MPSKGTKPSASFTICELRDIGIVSNDGTIPGYGISDSQTVHVLKEVMHILSRYTADEYLDENAMESGRTIYMPFPDYIIYKIIRDHREKLMVLHKHHNVRTVSTTDTPTDS
jgi:hypothetical protein